jgi:AraC family transcriptional regulator
MRDNMPSPRDPMPAASALPQSLLGYRQPGGQETLQPHTVKFGSRSQETRSAIVIIKLLDRATQVLNNDQAAAKEPIRQASALLKQECGWRDLGPQAAVQSVPKVARGGLAPWQMRRVIRHIDDSLASTIRTRDCARIAQLSTSHFSRAFKVSFGETFFKYIIRCRTERAREMMVMTDQPLCQIALNCGFADQSHLSRQFRHRVGSTPAAWRRQQRVPSALTEATA